MFENQIKVRGYELDSYNHVNNATYLNYFEQARWEIVNDTGILDYLKKKELLIVVTEIRIRYKGMAKVFDELVVKTNIERQDPYIVFKQSIFNSTLNRKITVAEVKTIIIDRNNMPVDIPDEMAELYFKSIDENI
jgi:YbgC/YbaW family acyl-CoA thioester hydrolase